MPAGYSIIADQLWATPTNAIWNVLNNDTQGSGNPGPFEGCEVLKYSPAIGNYLTDIADAADEDSGNPVNDTNGWVNGGLMTMNPGEAVWFQNNSGGPLTVTFVGTVPSGTNTVPLAPGYNMVASPVPFSGDLCLNAQLTNYNDGDELLTYNNATHAYTAFLVDEDDGSAYCGGYDNGTQPGVGDWLKPNLDPHANIGQGFWYQNNFGTASSWVQVFSINP